MKSYRTARFHHFNHRSLLAQVSIALGCLAAPMIAQAECRSAQPHISDAWCQAVKCAPVYTQGGFCTNDVNGTAADDDFEALSPVDDGGPNTDEQSDEERDDVNAVEADEDETATPIDADDVAGVNGADDLAAASEIGPEAECVSNQPHVSDAWCKAVACHPTYIASGHCTLNSDGSTANANDGNDAEDSTSRDEDEQLEIDETTALPEPDASSVTETQPVPADDSTESTHGNETVDQDTAGDDASEFEDSAQDKPAETMVEGQCPKDWRRVSKDCSNLPWQNSVRWHCSQQLPPSTTQLCGADDMDVTDEICTRRAGYLSAEWCVNPSPTKILVCGGTDCGVAAASNECRLIPRGGRGSVAQVCPN